MLVQERLILRVREVCAADERLRAALMYGSFAAGEGDRHSDVEFWLFFTPGGAVQVDPAAWCAQLGPVLHLVRNEFGAHVAVFPGLVRGEFHFASTDELPAVRDWPARGAPVEQMIVLDRDGRLRPVLEAMPERVAVPDGPAAAQELCGRFANWLLLAHHVASRGETVRAWDATVHLHRHLLWMTRLAGGRTAHWLTPSRRLEADLPEDTVTDLRRATGSAEPADVRRALRELWRQGRSRWTELAARDGFAVPEALFAELDATL